MFAWPYALLACLTFGSSISSGLFTPCLLVGATLGRLFGILVHFEHHNLAAIRIYSLIGAASLLGGMSRMTISLTTIVLEATGDLQYGLPLMLTFMAARWIGNLFNEVTTVSNSNNESLHVTKGLYDMHIQLREIPVLNWDPPKSAESISIDTIMDSQPVYLNKVR